MRVWLITGASTGIGRDLALAALKRGDKVIVTARARSLGKLEDLKSMGADAMELDVTTSVDTLNTLAEKAIAIHGQLDVLVNNAGYILMGAVEENTDEETRDQFNTNFFGGLNVTRAFLPYMRARKTGTIVWIGSAGGWFGAPFSGIYAATKFALRGISETLDKEIKPLGLRSICIDFGTFRTSLLDPAHRPSYVARIGDYAEKAAEFDGLLTKYDGLQPGDPKKGAEIVVDVVRGEGLAHGKEMPSSLLLGSDCYSLVQTELNSALKSQSEWREATHSTDF